MRAAGRGASCAARSATGPRRAIPPRSATGAAAGRSAAQERFRFRFRFRFWKSFSKRKRKRKRAVKTRRNTAIFGRYTVPHCATVYRRNLDGIPSASRSTVERGRYTVERVTVYRRTCDGIPSNSFSPPRGVVRSAWSARARCWRTARAIV